MKHGAEQTPEWHSKSKEIRTKTALETKSTKHAENVLTMMPSDLWKTSVRNEGLQNIIKNKKREQV